MSSEQLHKALRDAFDQGHPAATIVLARMILADDPEHAPTWARLGSMLSETANYNEAETALENALKYCDSSLRDIVYGKLGHLFKLRGDYNAATEWYRKAINANPNHAAGYIFLGAALTRQGNLSEAEAVHRRATECDDGCIDEAYLNLGLVLRGQARLEESRECFSKALEIDPEYEAAQEALDDVVEAIAYRSQNNA